MLGFVISNTVMYKTHKVYIDIAFCLCLFKTVYISNTSAILDYSIFLLTDLSHWLIIIAPREREGEKEKARGRGEEPKRE